MKARVLFFASLREKLKRNEGHYDLIPGETALELTQRILGPLSGGKDLTRALLFAVNDAYVSKDYRLKAGDELALIPPVAGG